jgi:hypothetical protein
MSKKIKFFGMFLLFFVASYAQTPPSYYYRGQKMELTVDRTVLHLIADSTFLQSYNSIVLFETLGMERLNQSKDFVKLKFNSDLTLSDDKTKVDSLRKHPQIHYILPFFENGENDPIGTSDLFYLKLKNSADTTLLQTIAAQQNVQVVKQIPYMPLWHVLSLRGSGFSNSLEATNFFYETGFFAAIDPAFLFDFKLHCTNDPMFNQLWGLGRVAGINACGAWEITKGAGVNYYSIINSKL